MVTETDNQLMILFSQGDVEAFSTLYERYKDSIYRYVVRTCGNPSLAEEITQETWISIINAKEKIDESTNFKGYLFRTAHNKVIDNFRKTSSLPAAVSDYDDSVFDIPDTNNPSAEHYELLLECIKVLYALLQKLPYNQRTIIIMREETQMTLEELAMSLNEKRETLKSRLRYALVALRRDMPEDCING